MNWSVVPFAITKPAALMLSDFSVADVTLKARTLEATPPCAAVMFVVPTARPAAKPAALIVAVAVFDELQVTELVKFCVLPSLKVPVAVN